MGFDLYAVKPINDSEEAGYFRNNVWWWRPLWNYIYEEKLINDEQYEQGGYNNGFIINKLQAQRMGIKLKHLVSQGKVKEYAEEYKKECDDLPDEPCPHCETTGKREWEEGGKKVLKTCNACHGKGSKRPWATCYPFSIDNVEEFANFCIASGGFSIC